MGTVNIDELKADTDGFVSLAEAGHSFGIVVAGGVAAILGPPRRPKLALPEPEVDKSSA